MKKWTRALFQAHPFHLVSPSPWPFFTSLSLFTMAVNGAWAMHHFYPMYIFFWISVFLVVTAMIFWFIDIIIEATFLGNHTSAVQAGLILGILLFIVSEALFFLAIFWAYFHSALTPAIELGAQWPPLAIEPVHPFELPLVNTVILLSSGVTITYGHHSLIKGDRLGAITGTIYTVILAFVFTLFQLIEYEVSSFTISDGVFGTCFFFSTGFHGFHVIIGTIFIAVGLWRIIDYHLTDHHHSGFEAGITYWHFVDIVWIFLYLMLYLWGS